MQPCVPYSNYSRRTDEEGRSTCFAYASGTNQVKFHLILCDGHVQSVSVVMSLVRCDIRNLPFGQIRPLAITVCRFTKIEAGKNFSLILFFFTHECNDFTKISSNLFTRISRYTQRYALADYIFTLKSRREI